MKENQLIKSVADSIVQSCNPLKIILISKKINTFDTLIGFKLAVIIREDVEIMPELECRLYMEIDCDIPFDLVLYSEEEWNDLKEDAESFAWKINETGTVLYG